MCYQEKQLQTAIIDVVFDFKMKTMRNNFKQPTLANGITLSIIEITYKVTVLN